MQVDTPKQNIANHLLVPIAIGHINIGPALVKSATIVSALTSKVKCVPPLFPLNTNDLNIVSPLKRMYMRLFGLQKPDC